MGSLPRGYTASKEFYHSSSFEKTVLRKDPESLVPLSEGSDVPIMAIPGIPELP